MKRTFKISLLVVAAIVALTFYWRLGPQSATPEFPINLAWPNPLFFVGLSSAVWAYRELRRRKTITRAPLHKVIEYACSPRADGLTFTSMRTRVEP